MMNSTVPLPPSGERWSQRSMTSKHPPPTGTEVTPQTERRFSFCARGKSSRARSADQSRAASFRAAHDRNSRAWAHPLTAAMDGGRVAALGRNSGCLRLARPLRRGRRLGTSAWAARESGLLRHRHTARRSSGVDGVRIPDGVRDARINAAWRQLPSRSAPSHKRMPLGAASSKPKQHAGKGGVR